MIANITRGSNFAGIGRYLYAVGKHHEKHENPRAVASSNVLRDDSRQWRAWVAEMEWAAQQRPDIVQPVWHTSIRTAPVPQDRTMTDVEWGQIAREHAEKMGLTEHPWVAVRHADDHIHIVACRVNGDGKVWRGEFDRPRSMESMREIEKRHGLTRVDEDRKTSRLATVSKSEREKGKRLGHDPDRALLRDELHAARGRGPGGFEEELDRRGVLHRANTTKDGLRVRGYSVSRPGWTRTAVDDDGKKHPEQVWVKASDVDRTLSWSKLQPDLGSDRARYADAIEMARTIAKAYPTRAEVAAARERGSAPPARAAFPGSAMGSAQEQAAARLTRLREQNKKQERERGMGR